MSNMWENEKINKSLNSTIAQISRDNEDKNKDFLEQSKKLITSFEKRIKEYEGIIEKLINKNRRDDFFNPDDKKKKPLIERKGDWLCPKCRNLNFAFRLICNRCQLPKSDAGGQMPYQNNMGKQRGFTFQICHPTLNFAKKAAFRGIIFPY